MMPLPPPPEDTAKWNRWFAARCNDRVWTLAEKSERTPAEQEEMLHGAHASAFHWSQVGTDLHKARADMLLGLVHALLGNGASALTYARRSFDYVTAHERESPDWETAFAHAVLAHAASAAKDVSLHTEHYEKARVLGEAIANAENRELFLRTFLQVPTPDR